MINVAKGLKAGDAPRDTEKTHQGTLVTYHLQDGIDLAFVYDDNGNPVIAENLNDAKKTVTYVSGGAALSHM